MQGLQGSHGKMRKGGYNCLTEALQASLLLFTKGASLWQSSFSKVSILERISYRFLSRFSRRSLPSGLCAGGRSIHNYILHTEILGPKQNSKDCRPVGFREA